MMSRHRQEGVSDKVMPLPSTAFSLEPVLSVVAPFFNEVEALPFFVPSLRSVLKGMGCSYEVLLVDDGSTDASIDYLTSLDWPECRVVQLARNYGHQEALDAGLRLAKGDWTVTMDSDLQHPPSAIPDMLLLARDRGVDVVYAARTQRSEDTIFKRTSASAYYHSMRGLTGVPVQQGAADFRLLSRAVVDTVNALPEEKVFRLLLPYLGFPYATFQYVADLRVAGKSKYSLSRMGRLTASSIIQFSTRPLQVSIALGLMSSFFAIFWLAIAIVAWVRGATIEGWTSLAVMVLFFSGVQLLSIGVIGVYLGRLYDFVRLRPRHRILSVIPLGGNSSEQST